MRTWLATTAFLGCRFAKAGAAAVSLILLSAVAAFAQPAESVGGEASLRVPDLSSVQFLGVSGHRLLLVGILFCLFGLLFGLAIYTKLKNLPVHRAMREISELIYETCKTYFAPRASFWLFCGGFMGVFLVFVLVCCR